MSGKQLLGVELRLSTTYPQGGKVRDWRVVLLDVATSRVLDEFQLPDPLADPELSVSPDRTAVAVTYCSSRGWESPGLMAVALEVDEHLGWRVLLCEYREPEGTFYSGLPAKVIWSRGLSLSPAVSFKWVAVHGHPKAKGDSRQSARRAPSARVRIVSAESVIHTEPQPAMDSEAFERLMEEGSEIRRQRDELAREKIRAIKESGTDKELFDPRKFGSTAHLGPLEQLGSNEQYIVFDYEKQYYLAYPQFKTMLEFSEYLLEMESWGGNS